MSDNTSQQGTDTIATDDVAGVKYQRVKVTFGVDGAATDASASNPLPVDASVSSLPDVVVSTLPPLAAGTNNIGDVDIATMPAADKTTDSIAAVPTTGAVMSGASALTPKYAKITASSSGATTIVSAVTSKKIRVLSWSLVCNAAVNVKWQSHVTPTDLTGLHYFAANGGISKSFSPVGYFETVAGEALDINLSGAIAVGGSLVYVEV